MSQQDILNLAKEGDARAIAFLIGQALESFGVTAKASRENDSLHLLLEAEQLPAEEACLRVAVKGLQRLQPNNVYSLTVYGRRSGQQLPAWTQTIELKKRQTPAPVSAAVSASAAVAASLPASPIPVTLPKLETTQNVTTAYTQIPEKSQPKPPQIPTPKPTNQRQQKPSPQPELVGTKTKKSGLSTRALSLILVPIFGFVLASQLYKSSSTPTNNPLRSKPAVQKVSSTPPPAPAAKPLPAPKSPSAATKKPATVPATVSIKAVGDMIPGTNFPYNKLPAKKELLLESVKPYLKGADILFGNFESTMTDYPYSSKAGGGRMLFAFRTPPSYAKIFKDVGFDILNIANNHSYDFNEQGFKDTIKNIDSNGMKAVGKKNQIVYQNVKGVNFAFIGFSNYGEVHNSLLELKAGAEVVKKAKQNADIVVISVHAGAEGTGALNVRNKNELFYGENRGNMVLFSRTMIDAGADLILGHGPHVIRAMELYKGKLIAYSLGNFLGYRTLSTAGALGQSLILDVKMTPRGDFVSGKIIPIQLDGRGIPSVDNNFRSVGLIGRLTKSDFPNSGLTIEDKGQILKQSK
ncbi:CapA family protein [Microcoleus sp. OTE_8_concoct_300]|uniref:CapA family protein n=1 Tax=Microcoleus sp. OTE_8_concoct_300 TaxID=2964710 RepID=UPI00403F1371